MKKWDQVLLNTYTANRYSQCTAFVQSKGCNENLITAIDSALSLAVIYYSQATANVQLMTAEVPKLGCNQLSSERLHKIPLRTVIWLQGSYQWYYVQQKTVQTTTKYFSLFIFPSIKSKQTLWQSNFVWWKIKTTQTPTKKKYLVSIFEKVQINKKPEPMKYYCITFQPRESPIR